MTHLPMIATAFLLVTGPAAAETNWSWTGPNGGVTNGSTQCDRQSGQVLCNSSGIFTGPKGRTSNWLQERRITQGDVNGRRTIVGPRGGERVVTWSRIRQR